MHKLWLNQSTTTLRNNPFAQNIKTFIFCLFYLSLLELYKHKLTKIIFGQKQNLTKQFLKSYAFLNLISYLSAFQQRSALIYVLYQWLQQFNRVCISNTRKMIKTNSFQVQPIQITSLTSLSQEDLNKSLTFSTRSGKDHSVTQTDCSQFSTTKYVTDSEEESEKDKADEQQKCNNYYMHGSCPQGMDCIYCHTNPKAQSLKNQKSLFFDNFPQLVMIVGQRRRSFLE